MKKQFFIIMIQSIFIVHIYGQNIIQNNQTMINSDILPCYQINKSVPSPAGTIIGLNSVCQGTQFVTYKVPPVSGATSYIWTLPSGFTGVSNTDSIILTIDSTAVSGSVTVKGHNSSGDGTESSLFVIVNILPLVSFYTTSVNGCQPLPVAFSDNSYPSSSFCIWNFGDGSTSNLNYPTHIYNLPGNYNVQLTSTTTQGCTATVIIPNLITVYPQPIADFTWNPPIGTLSNPVINFVNLSTPIDISTNWFWDFGDGVTSNDKNPTHSFPNFNSNSYTTVLIASTIYGCSDTVAYPINILETSVTENNLYNVNITFDNFRSILSVNNITRDTEVSVYNIQGQLLLHEFITQSLTKFNISQFAKGVYIVKIGNENNSLIRKFLKE